MNKNEIYVLLWSRSQNALHIETLNETEQSGLRSYRENNANDCIVLWVADSYEKVSAAAKTLREKHESP